MGHFEQLEIKDYSITGHFKRDVGCRADATAIALDVLDSRHKAFEELHKLEETIAGNHIFRAKIHGQHIVYAVTNDRRLVFLRVFKDFNKYKRYLEDKRDILKSLE